MIMEKYFVTELVNLKVSKCDVRIDRTSIFGNPFVVGRDGDRDLVIKKFKAYFYNKVWRDDEFRNNVLALIGKSLGCWCKPMDCHGDVIVEFLEMYEDGEFDNIISRMGGLK